MASPVHEGMVRGAVALDKNDGDRTRSKLTRDPLIAAVQVEAKLCDERSCDVQKTETASLPDTLRAEFFRNLLDVEHTFRDGHPRLSSFHGPATLPLTSKFFWKLHRTGLDSAGWNIKIP